MMLLLRYAVMLLAYVLCTSVAVWGVVAVWRGSLCMGGLSLFLSQCPSLR